MKKSIKLHYVRFKDDFLQSICMAWKVIFYTVTIVLLAIPECHLYAKSLCSS